MVTLTNGRKNYSFTATAGTYNFEGSCAFSDNGLKEVSSSIFIPAANADDPKDYVGSFSYNYNTADTTDNDSVGVSINVNASIFDTVYSAVLTVLHELTAENI